MFPEKVFKGECFEFKKRGDFSTNSSGYFNIGIDETIELEVIPFELETDTNRPIVELSAEECKSPLKLLLDPGAEVSVIKISKFNGSTKVDQCDGLTTTALNYNPSFYTHTRSHLHTRPRATQPGFVFQNKPCLGRQAHTQSRTGIILHTASTLGASIIADACA